MDALIPTIEEGVALPANAKDAFPDLTPMQELEMRANVIKLMSDMTGQPITPSQENAEEAEELAKEMVANPSYKPTFSQYPNETLAMLAGMVAQMNVAVVDDLTELKMYVVNNLIKEVEMAKDPKTRIAALTKLGEIDGVDAFKKRSEVTMKVQTIEEVEKELLETLNVLEQRVIDVEFDEVRADT
jgi:hypothetical protein